MDDQVEQVQPGSQGFYREEPAPIMTQATESGVIEWEASEYIHHDKGAGWLVGLVILASAMVGLALWLGQWTFAFLLVVMAIAFGYYAVRKPRVLHYRLSQTNLAIGQKSFQLSDFSAFGVIDDGALYFIRLIPIKRLSPALMIYFGKEDGEKIVDILGKQIPMQPMKSDPIDVFMRILRF